MMYHHIVESHCDVVLALSQLRIQICSDLNVLECGCQDSGEYKPKLQFHSERKSMENPLFYSFNT